MVQKMLSLTEGRKKIFQLADDVQIPGTYYVLTENGKGKAVLLGITEFESLIETLEVLQESPHLLEDVAQIEQDVESGTMDSYVSLEMLLKETVLVSDQKATYVTGRKAHTKSK